MNTPTATLEEWLSGSRDGEMRVKCAEELGIQTSFFRFLIPYHDGAKIWRDKYKTRDEADTAHAQSGKWVASEVEEYTDVRHVSNYPASLDACVELRAALKTDDEQLAFSWWLVSVVTGRTEEVGFFNLNRWELFLLMNATPRQIVLAFLLARGRVAIS